jgi:hypothetical protein
MKRKTSACLECDFMRCLRLKKGSPRQHSCVVQWTMWRERSADERDFDLGCGVNVCGPKKNCWTNAHAQRGLQHGEDFACAATQFHGSDDWRRAPWTTCTSDVFFAVV